MHEGHRERMREKYLKQGINSFSEHEIVEMILYYSIARGNTNEIAHALLDEFGCIGNVFAADPQDLMNVKGVGPQSAMLIKLIREISAYCSKNDWPDKPEITSADVAGTYLTDTVGNPSDEYFYLMSLDAQNKVIAVTEIEHGVVANATVNVRKVLECAVRLHAVSVILAHNHPSGMLEPSEKDIRLTKILENALAPIGVAVIDHIILGKGGYLSMSEKGLMA